MDWNFTPTPRILPSITQKPVPVEENVLSDHPTVKTEHVSSMELDLKHPEETETKPQHRVDHRKTSWMNGFMMYSRMHRRSYIE